MKAQGAGAAQSGCNQWVPILRDRPTDKPFFLWLAAVDLHRDYQPGTIPASRTAPKMSSSRHTFPMCPTSGKGPGRHYYDEISRLDHYVGEVLAELDRQGIARNTLVLFLSDNGRPFPRCKTTLYDSGIRTPFIVRWPGHVRAGTRCGSLVSTIDIAPTVLRACGFDPGPTVQGKDLSPMFKDPSAKVRDLIFAERNWHDFAAHGRVPVIRRVQVHQERRPRFCADAPRRCGAQPYFPNNAPAPGCRQADRRATHVLREAPAVRGALQRGR